MRSRSLEHTGGTLDKLVNILGKQYTGGTLYKQESIPGNQST